MHEKNVLFFETGQRLGVSTVQLQASVEQQVHMRALVRLAFRRTGLVLMFFLCQGLRIAPPNVQPR
jgi:hypothetical protein